VRYLIVVVVLLLAVLSGLAIGNWIRSRVGGADRTDKRKRR
jgi:thiosulfate reductase cytochrome b subunit